MDDNLVYDSLQTSRCDVERLSDHFQCPCGAINTFQGEVPAQLLLSSFLVCLSLHVPQAFFWGGRESCRVATRNGQTGQLPPPETFANMMVFVLYMKRFFSKLCYLYVNFSRQPFRIRMCCAILDKTINQSMHHASENSQHRTGDKL